MNVKDSTGTVVYSKKQPDDTFEAHILTDKAYEVDFHMELNRIEGSGKRVEMLSPTKANIYSILDSDLLEGKLEWKPNN